MSTEYTIKKAKDLLQHEVDVILKNWEVEEWEQMSLEEFKEKFTQSEFHFLTDQSLQIFSLARINFDFKIQIQNTVHEIAELVGLVAIVKRNGYGKKLIGHIQNNLKDRNIEAIGFCEKHLRSFYTKCNVAILYDKAKQMREKQIDTWVVPTDDDILNLSLSKVSSNLLEGLSANNIGYLLFSDQK